MTTYELDFVPSAWREWKKLDPDLRRQLAKKLEERCRHPHVLGDRLSGLPNCYKIKLRKSGYRLVYEVEQRHVTIMVISIGRRERKEAYRDAEARLKARR